MISLSKSSMSEVGDACISLLSQDDEEVVVLSSTVDIVSYNLLVKQTSYIPLSSR